MINCLMIDNINMMYKEKDDTYYNKKYRRFINSLIIMTTHIHKIPPILPFPKVPKAFGIW
jgi:hypothetical protein